MPLLLFFFVFSTLEHCLHACVFMFVRVVKMCVGLVNESALLAFSALPSLQLLLVIISVFSLYFHHVILPLRTDPLPSQTSQVI